MTRCCFRKYLTFYLLLLAVESFSFLELPSLLYSYYPRSDSRRTSYYYKSIVGTTSSSGSTTTSNSISYNKLGELSLLSKKQTQQQEENAQHARKISAAPPKRRTRSSNQQQQQQSSTRTANKSTIQQKTTVVEEQHQGSIRLNKVFKETHSRRQADDLIASGRVTVNGKPVANKGGFMVVPYHDIIAVDGKVVKGWERMNGFDVPSEAVPGRNGGGTANSFTSSNQQSTPQESLFVGNNLKTEQFEYVKYFKPLGVTCTTDERIRENIIYAIKRDGYVPRHRVFPVGRLDKETTGLIILTSDGRLVNSVLRGEMKQPKVYKVMVDGRLNDKHLERLRNGVTITTVAQRKGKTIQENTLVAKTKPCSVERLGPCSCKMTLMEGRNRQLRKMMEALGFTVVKLHRVEFMGIHLGGGAGGDSANGTSKNGLLRPGDWAYLDASEMDLVKKALQRSSLCQVSTQHASVDEKEEEEQ